MKLSILIVNWNTRTLLQECIQSVYQSTRRVDFEIAVVDNGSTDGSVEMVKAAFPEVIVQENKANLGFAAANNQGFKLCSGDMVLLLNSDTRVLDGTIDSCVEYMEQHPRTGALGCRVLYPDGTFQSSYFRFTSLFELFLFQCLGMRMFEVMVRRLGFTKAADNSASRYWGKQFAKATEVDVVAGCFLLVRRPVIDEVGLLDEDFFFYGEEEEWCFRIKHAGWSVVYYPLAEIVHLHGASSQKLSGAALAGRKAKLIYFDKTRGPVAAWCGNLIMIAGTILRTPFWLFAYLLKGRGAGGGRSAFLGRLELLRFHFAGLFKPVWKQAPAGQEERQPQI